MKHRDDIFSDITIGPTLVKRGDDYFLDITSDAEDPKYIPVVVIDIPNDLLA